MPPAGQHRPVEACVAGLILNDRGDVLLSERQKGWWQGTWSLPGGKMDVGESPEQTFYRELLEETGYTSQMLNPPSLLPYIDSFCYPDEGRQMLGLYYVSEAYDPPPVYQEVGKHGQFQFFPLNNLPSPLMDASKGLLEWWAARHAIKHPIVEVFYQVRPGLGAS